MGADEGERASADFGSADSNKSQTGDASSASSDVSLLIPPLCFQSGH